MPRTTRAASTLTCWARERGLSVHDCGTDSTDSVDYPDFAQAVARLVADGDCGLGIVVDGAGIGLSVDLDTSQGETVTLPDGRVMGKEELTTEFHHFMAERKL